MMEIPVYRCFSSFYCFSTHDQLRAFESGSMVGSFNCDKKLPLNILKIKMPMLWLSDHWMMNNSAQLTSDGLA